MSHEPYILESFMYALANTSDRDAGFEQSHCSTDLEPSLHKSLNSLKNYSLDGKIGTA